MTTDTAVSGVLERTWHDRNTASIEGTLRGFLATVYRPDGTELAQASFPVATGDWSNYGQRVDAAYAVAQAWLALWGLESRN